MDGAPPEEAPRVLPIAAERPRRKPRIVPAANDPPPTIRLVEGDIERIVDEAESALISANRGLYQRDGRIVCAVGVPILTAQGPKVAVQRIAERGDHALCEDLASAGNFVKWDGRARANVAVTPPGWIVRTLRQRTGRLRFPVLTGIVNAPTMRADGSILDSPGYDGGTGLLYDPLGVEFPRIADSPTRDEARAAMALLDDLVSTFPFVSGVDRSVALSAILTAPVRRSLATAPMHAYTAPVAGSGKSMLVDIASIVATGHEAPVLGPGQDEGELEKRLGAVLLAGDPIVTLDNCERPLGGELLCKMLSQTWVKPRILGQSQTPELTTGAFVTATGNNLVLVGDLTRRSLLCRLDPKCERPETRVFGRNPLALAKADRPRYVTAALTILRAFHVAGRPSSTNRLGSFEDWSDLIRGALLWLGCAEPVVSMEAVRKADPRRADLANVAAQWRTAIGLSKRVTVAEVIRTAGARAELREALIAVAGEQRAVNNRRLGKWLAEVAGRIVDGSRFEQCGQRQGVALWRLETA